MIPTPLSVSVHSRLCIVSKCVKNVHIINTHMLLLYVNGVNVWVLLSLFDFFFSSLNISKLSCPTGPLHTQIFTACENVCVCVCMCVSERDRGGIKRERETKSWCV